MGAVLAIAEDNGDEIPKRVGDIWEKVFKASNAVLVQHQQFGFQGIELIPDPNIHTILVQLRVLTAVMQAIIDNADLEYAHSRLILNAKSQLSRIETVALALQAKDKDGYEKAMTDLESQAAF